VATEPFDKYNAAPVIDGSHQATVIPLDVKHHPVSPYDADDSVLYHTLSKAYGMEKHNWEK
jgi:hypothetical protein